MLKKRHKMCQYLYDNTILLMHNVRYTKKYIRLNDPILASIYATLAAHNAKIINTEINRLINCIGEWMP